MALLSVCRRLTIYYMAKIKNEPRYVKTVFCTFNPKTQISRAVSGQLISAFVFAT